MNAPGKGLLKVVSILFIIFGAIATIASLIGVFGAIAAASLVSAATDAISSEVGTAVAAAVGPMLIVALIIAIADSVLTLIIGIMGVGKSGDVSKADFFVKTGIVLCIIALISVIFSIVGGSFSVTSLIGFVLPILYIVGGNQNKKAAALPPQQ